MEIFKKISLKRILVISFSLFILLIISISSISIYEKYREKKIHELEIAYNKLKSDYIDILKYQDFLFLFSSDKYFKKVQYYDIYTKKLSRTIVVLDSVMNNNNVKSSIIKPILLDLKENFFVYENIVSEILDINSESYTPEIGIDYKLNYIKNNLLSNKKYIELDLIFSVDSIDVLKELLFAGIISKREFQKKSNLLIKSISEIDVSQNNQYYLFLFEDNLSEYYNNILLQYTNHVTIGSNYNEGLLYLIKLQNYYILREFDIFEIELSKIRSNNYKRNIILYVSIMIFIILLILFLFKYIHDSIYSPWKQIKFLFTEISKGSFPDVESLNTYNSIKEIAVITSYISESVENLKSKNLFIEYLTKGDYDAILEAGNKDVLGQSLLKLKKELVASKKEAVKFRETEENQKWSANGIAKIGAVMRQFTEDTNDLAKNILREIIEYIDAVQGVIYINNRDENFLEQATAISYGKARQQNKKILPYEGLLGTILVEQREYFYETVPDDYVFLETGFGVAKPKSLFAFPLIFENSIYGIIEVASLEVIPEYKRHFLLTLANEIAITISYTEINVQTKELFEQSKKQADELKSNEKLFKKNQDNLKSLLRMTEDHLNETIHSLKLKEKLVKEKIADLIDIEKELNKKEEYIENITNEYENMKSYLDNQNKELRQRIEELENRIRNKD